MKHQLDLYYPEVRPTASDVIVFIHGGTWMNGSKDMYSSLGRNLAEKGIVAAVINYRLGDLVNYKKMAQDCAAAVKWVYGNVSDYGGNKRRITVCGHSAGGHLSALISLDHSYFDQLNIDNPIKKCILIDAFGLNIGNFIRDHGAVYLHLIEKVFTNNPQGWHEASPVNHIKDRSLPFLIMTGSSTYPFLLHDNTLFLNKLKKYHHQVQYLEILGKTHVEMITQFNDINLPLYTRLIEFVKHG